MEMIFIVLVTWPRLSNGFQLEICVVKNAASVITKFLSFHHESCIIRKAKSRLVL